jgi:psp operon transcriptional activator
MDHDLPELIGQAPSFLAMQRHLSAVAPLDRPILVIGERGVGKELIAARLHYLSSRWDQPLVKVNCAALASDLLESELFGHDPGAFTGAVRRHAGRFERADQGTLFLDEIASASLRVQEKLLRVIEYGEYERLGGDRTLRCDVRLIGATNVDLPAWAADGRFRADLLDRLAFDVIQVPPLRSRITDIAPLAVHFAQAMAHELGTTFAGFDPAALKVLDEHPWPGNVRELKNVVERSFYRHVADDLADEPVSRIILDPFASAQPSIADETPVSRPEARVKEDDPPSPDRPYDYRAHVDRIERRLLSEALAINGHHQRQTADYLQLSYDQLRGLIRKFDLAGRSEKLRGKRRNARLGRSISSKPWKTK